MKRALIVALLCLNVGLLLALVFGTAIQPDYGQSLGTIYVVVSGKMAANWDALFVIDQAKRRLRAIGYNKTSRRIAPIGDARDLNRDFGRGEAR